MVPSISRYRARGKFTNTCPPIQNAIKYQTCAAPSWVDQGGPFGTIYTGVVETMQDVVTPKFERAREHGTIIMNPLIHSRLEATTVDGVGWHTKRNPANLSCAGVPQATEQRGVGPWFNHLMWALYSTTTSPVAYASIISNEEVNSLVTEISTKALAKRGGSENNLFESIAQYRQTLRLFGNPLKSLHKLLTSAEKMIGKSKSAAEVWLTIRYGVMPLIKDMTGIITGLEKKIGNMRVTTRARGEIMRSEIASLSYNSGVFVTPYGIQKTDSVIVRAMSLDEYFVSKAENIGFASKGLITVPWELIPYSFVADWFVNFGDYLNALVPLPALKNLGSCVTVYRARNTIYTCGASTPGVGYDLVQAPTGSCSVSSVLKIRTPSIQPGLIIKNDFRFTDAVRLADAVSLIVQRMGSIFGRR